MGELIKMKIIGFKEGKFQSKRNELDLQINPASLKYTMGISYSKDKRMGVSGKEIKFDSYDDSTLAFDILLDDTGVIPMKRKSIVDMINFLEEVLYNLDGDTHDPNYLHVNWGSFSYKGRVSSLSYDYTMFRPDGSPLRVKISVTITGYMNRLYESQIVNRRSPDLSRLIVLKSGESVAFWCNEIYGDGSYCMDVARHNNLSDFRNIPAGTELLFPPLVKT